MYLTRLFVRKLNGAIRILTALPVQAVQQCSDFKAITNIAAFDGRDEL